MSEEKPEEVPAPPIVPSPWDDIHLVHEALPAVDADAVDLSAKLLGHGLRLPLVVYGMPGAHGRAVAVNELIARVVERAGIGVLASSTSRVRVNAPSAFVAATVRMSEVSGDVRDLVKTTGADALALQLDGAEASLRAIVRSSPVPVIASSPPGITRPTALRLRRLGVEAFELGGIAPNTSSGITAAERDDAPRMSIGERFRDWGIPAPVSIVAAAPTRLPIIASGVRSGLDAAKALALGASAVGVGRQFLQMALLGEQAIVDWLAAFELELRTAVFLSGLKRASELARAPVVITGRSQAWLDQLAYRRSSTASRTARSS